MGRFWLREEMGIGGAMERSTLFSRAGVTLGRSLRMKVCNVREVRVYGDASSPWSRPSASMCTTTLCFYDEEEVSSADVLPRFLLNLLPKAGFHWTWVVYLTVFAPTFRLVSEVLTRGLPTAWAATKPSQKSGDIGSDSKGSNLVFVY